MSTLYESLKKNENIKVNALYFENKSYTFKEVVKQTSIVLVVVLVFGLVLFGFERLCSWLTGFLF